MSTYARWLAAAAIMLSCFACGGDDDGDDPSGADDGDNASRTPGDQAPRAPTQEEISAALADAGIFVDEGGVTIGETRIDVGEDGIRWDDAAVVSLNDGSVILGAGDASVTIRTDGTCDELLACCESLTDEATKMECTTTHSGLVGIPFGGGDFLCGNFVTGFCP